MLAVSIQSGPTMIASRPQMFFEGEFLAPQTGFRPYDVGPDGRFVVIRTVGDAAAPDLVVVQHWSDELKRLVPVK
jgi:hypothetical protein